MSRGAGLALALLLGGCQLIVNFDDVPERAAQCADDLDNDRDNLIDCADPGCADVAACMLRCGDGRQEGGEACDDGNTTPGDGCTATCTLELCGDGLVNNTRPGQRPEECDDANAVEGDLCDSNCTTPRCGNGIVDPLRPDFRRTRLVVDSPIGLGAGIISEDSTIDVVAASAMGEIVELHNSGPVLVPQTPISVPRTVLTAIAVEALDFGFGSDVLVADTMFDDLCGVPNCGGSGGQPQRAGDVAGDPTAILVADLDLDSDRDVLVATAAGPTLFTQDGEGNLTASAPSVPESPTALAAADVDRDEAPDLVFVVESTDHVIVLRQTGAMGSFPFAARPAVTVGDRPIAVVVGDLDGARGLDLVTANAGSNDLSVLLADAAGGHAVQPAIALPAAPTALALADLDGDGDLDLAVGLSGARLALFRGDGRGGFTPAPGLALDGDARAIIAVDLDGDGLSDLVTAETAADRVTVLYSQPLRETCDDGNTVDGDSCPATCRSSAS